MGDQPAIECPKCRCAMRRVDIDDFTIDRCQKCAGLWLHAADLETLIGDKARGRAADTGPVVDPERMDSITRITCPVDHSDMVHMVDSQQRHVGYESCTICGGVFLDAGELADLSEFTLRERLRTIFG